jgi:Uma2 family endonuclease
MIATQTLPRLSVEEYPAHERESDCRHELVGGHLYGITGASDRHEAIAANLRLILTARSDVARAHRAAPTLTGRMSRPRPRPRGSVQIDLAWSGALPM